MRVAHTPYARHKSRQVGQNLAGAPRPRPWIHSSVLCRDKPPWRRLSDWYNRGQNRRREVDAVVKATMAVRHAATGSKVRHPPASLRRPWRGIRRFHRWGVVRPIGDLDGHWRIRRRLNQGGEPLFAPKGDQSSAASWFPALVESMLMHPHD